MKGFYLINKPAGITSHDVINRLRKITGEKTIGHAGTLDPAASGLLIIAIGKELTSKISKYVGLDKEYIASVTLGKVSSTYDKEGEIRQVSSKKPSEGELENVLENFTGTYNQIPPIYSAKKIKGQPAYKLARKGQEPKLKPVPATIYQIQMLEYNYPYLKIKTLVSSGTYIRSLAHDIGQKLGTGAYLSSLVRTKIGNYLLEQAVNVDEIQSPYDLEKAKI